MIRLIRWLIFGDGHIHDWEIIDEGAISNEKLIDQGKSYGKYSDERCKICKKLRRQTVRFF